MGEIHGAKRVFAFFLLTAVLPTILIVIPLYLRHIVFADVYYKVAETDIMAIEEGISSIFCESMNLKMNTTFNAFQLKGPPKVSHKRRHIRLKKSMNLPDDTLEYWGFFLLKGSTVKLRVCSRYEGSRILVVRGDRHLKTCGLLNHNLKKYGAKFDQEHAQVKVTFENAEHLGVVDKYDENTAAEIIDGENVNNFLSKRLKNRDRINNNNRQKTKQHRKRHIINNKKIEQLKKHLEKSIEPGELIRRIKRDALDAHILHGGNSHNNSLILEESSISSFETDLLTCYDGSILLTEGFENSPICTNIQYLEHSKHMVTNHEVASDGYYYYIFYSDNDLVNNDIHAIFDIYKPTYRFANSSSKTDCINQTECTFTVNFMTDETVIVEVPTKDGIEHDEDDITILISKCYPRMAVYMIFPISILFLILGCAFL